MVLYSIAWPPTSYSETTQRRSAPAQSLSVAGALPNSPVCIHPGDGGCYLVVSLAGEIYLISEQGFLPRLVEAPQASDAVLAGIDMIIVSTKAHLLLVNRSGQARGSETVLAQSIKGAPYTYLWSNVTHHLLFTISGALLTCYRIFSGTKGSIRLSALSSVELRSAPSLFTCPTTGDPKVAVDCYDGQDVLEDYRLVGGRLTLQSRVKEGRIVESLRYSSSGNYLGYATRSGTVVCHRGSLMGPSFALRGLGFAPKIEVTDRGHVISCSRDVPAKITVSGAAPAPSTVPASRFEGYPIDIRSLASGLVVITDRVGFVYYIHDSRRLARNRVK